MNGELADVDVERLDSDVRGARGTCLIVMDYEENEFDYGSFTRYILVCPFQVSIINFNPASEALLI